MNENEYLLNKIEKQHEFEKLQMAHDLRMLELKEKRQKLQWRWKKIIMFVYFLLTLGVGWEVHTESYGWATTHALMAYWMAKNYFDDKFLNDS